MKTKSYISRKFRKGSLLGLVMVIALCLALLGAGMLSLGYGSRMNAAVSTYFIDARTAADAGLQDALYQMNLNFKGLGSWPASPSPVKSLPNSTSKYFFSVSDIGSGHFQVDSEGTSAGKIRKVHAITDYASMFDYALFVTNDLFLHSGASVDAYNSLDGPYGGENSGLFVEIGSETEFPSQGNPEEGIGLDSGVTVTGSVAVGTGLSDDQIWGAGGGTHPVLDAADPELIQGGAYSPEISYIWGDIPAPPPYDLVLTNKITLPNDANESIGIGGSLTEAQTILCEGIDMQQGSLLTINGNVTLYLKKTSQNGTGDFKMITDASLVITPGSSLTLYVDNVFNTTNTNYINNLTKYAGNFTIYGTYPETGTNPPEWDIGSNSDFYGVVYAPNVNVIIRNSGDYYGSIAARSCEVKNSGGIHYDIALANETKFFTGYIIQRWWEEAVN